MSWPLRLRLELWFGWLRRERRGVNGGPFRGDTHNERRDLGSRQRTKALGSIRYLQRVQL